MNFQYYGARYIPHFVDKNFGSFPIMTIKDNAKPAPNLKPLNQDIPPHLWHLCS